MRCSGGGVKIKGGVNLSVLFREVGERAFCGSSVTVWFDRCVSFSYFHPFYYFNKWRIEWSNLKMRYVRKGPKINTHSRFDIVFNIESLNDNYYLCGVEEKMMSALERRMMNALTRFLRGDLTQTTTTLRRIPWCHYESFQESNVDSSVLIVDYSRHITLLHIKLSRCSCRIRSSSWVLVTRYFPRFISPDLVLGRIESTGKNWKLQLDFYNRKWIL